MFNEYRAASEEGKAELREKIVSHFLVYARQLCRVTPHPSLSDDEAISAANMGLLAAVDRYDPDHGVGFGSFVRKFIIGSIKQENTKAWRASGCAKNTVPEDTDIQEVVPRSGPDDLAAFQDSYEQLLKVAKKIISRFTQRDQDIFYAAYQEGLSFSQVAKKFGVTRQRVGQITKEIREAVLESAQRNYGDFDL